MKQIDIVAVGAGYVDTNVGGYPFDNTGIPVESELVGGAYEVVAGGSAVNFCRLMGRLGVHTAFIGIAGDDANADVLERSLRDHNVEPYIARRSDLVTNIGFNMTNPGGKHIMLVAGTANSALALGVIHEQVNTALAEASLLYMGGCFKLRALAPDFGTIVSLAQNQGAQVVVDHGRIPQQLDDELAESVRQLVLGAAYYLPSREEFCTLWAVSNIEDGLRLLQSKAPALEVIVKDGERGAVILLNDTCLRVAAPVIEGAHEVTGAGDSFNAGVMTAILRGQPKEQAVAYGCAVAAAKITRSELPNL